MSIRFDLTDLQLFLHVAEAGSITQGASRTNITLASASERIRAMEDTIGVPLLERKRRGVQLTPSGSALEQHARIIMRQLEEMRGELNDFSKGLRCRVRVLANTVATVEYLPPILATFLSVHPNIEIDLEERSSGDIIRAVAEGLADIGIVAEATNPADELETFPFAEDRLVLITPRRQVLGPRREIAFREVLPRVHRVRRGQRASEDIEPSRGARRSPIENARTAQQLRIRRSDGRKRGRAWRLAGKRGAAIPAVNGRPDRFSLGRLGRSSLHGLHAQV
jgi:molybdate transport repressor ModE-like protein